MATGSKYFLSLDAESQCITYIPAGADMGQFNWVIRKPEQIFILQLAECKCGRLPVHPNLFCHMHCCEYCGEAGHRRSVCNHDHKGCDEKTLLQIRKDRMVEIRAICENNRDRVPRYLSKRLEFLCGEFLDKDKVLSHEEFVLMTELASEVYWWITRFI